MRSTPSQPGICCRVLISGRGQRRLDTRLSSSGFDIGPEATELGHKAQLVRIYGNKSLKLAPCSAKTELCAAQLCPA